ncbi:hypothetical protein ACWFRF_01035 [Nocardia sp. NPDC055165]
MAESLVAEAVDKQFLETHRPVASAVRGRRPVGDAAVAAVAAPGWVGIGAEGGKGRCAAMGETSDRQHRRIPRNAGEAPQRVFCGLMMADHVASTRR